MGQQEGKVSSNSIQGHGLWQQYMNEVNNSQKSEITPFTKAEIVYLQKVFSQLDKKSTKSLQLKSMQQMPFIRQHPLFQRIMTLFQQQLKKIKTKKISIQIFLHLLTIFHINTPIQQKKKYLFRLYDWDKDYKLSHSDLVETFKLMLKQKIQVMGEEGFNNMAQEGITRFGVKGEIRMEEFVDRLQDDEVREIMNAKFTRRS